MHAPIVNAIAITSAHAVCGLGVPYLEGLLVDLDVPTYSTGSLRVYE